MCSKCDLLTQTRGVAVFLQPRHPGWPFPAYGAARGPGGRFRGSPPPRWPFPGERAAAQSRMLESGYPSGTSRCPDRRAAPMHIWLPQLLRCSSAQFAQTRRSADENEPPLALGRSRTRAASQLEAATLLYCQIIALVAACVHPTPSGCCHYHKHARFLHSHRSTPSHALPHHSGATTQQSSRMRSMSW
jgi:hypothetical protein